MILLSVTKTETDEFLPMFGDFDFFNLPIPMFKNGLKIGLVFLIKKSNF
jgi:hypothetical protein